MTEAAAALGEDLAAAPAAEAGQALPVTPAYAKYAIGVLLSLYVLNFLDRQVMSILAEPIKTELNLHDWQLGMMTGLAFALLYTLLGIPIARIAERGDRPLIIGASAGIWSACTIACAFAGGFAQLVLARIGVGIGEAGCTPAAHSLISDYTPKEKRASAIAVYMTGNPIGIMLGLALGGLVAGTWGWRAAFLVAGAPGILMAVIAAITLIEPRRKAAWRAAMPPLVPAGEALKELARNRTYWLIVTSVTLISFFGYGAAAFNSSFFLRNHLPELEQLGARFGLPALGFLGLTLGLVGGLTGGIGSVVGGRLTDYLAKRNPHWHMRVPAIGTTVALPLTLLVLTTPSALVAFVLMIPAAFCNGLWLGPAYGAIQGLVQQTSRATSTAVLLFISNLIGLGLGPLTVGIVSDLLAASLHQSTGDALRWALMAVAFLAIPAGVCFWIAGKSIEADTVS